MVLVAMVVTRRPVTQDVRAYVDVVRGHDAALEQEGFERAEPAVVVAVLPRLVLASRDLGDQAGLEVLPGEQYLIGQGGSDTERPDLPRLPEHELAVGAGEVRDFFE